MATNAVRTYAFAGASTRGLDAYAMPMIEGYADCARIVGVFDINPGRAGVFAQRCGGIPVFGAFDDMVQSARPDCVIVTTVDAYHSEYAIRALELGCDVIVEKPLTTDAGKLRAILEAEKRCSGKVTVIFNMRYTPLASKLRELVQAGAVGRVYSVHFEWMLDRVMAFKAHGASYFRRWNARMDKSGGLLLHKSSHHFDLVNWVIGASPKMVSGFGKLNLYGSNGVYRGENCRTCHHSATCEFNYKLTDFEKAFYADQEHFDGYYKDGCVYAQDIDIYDTVSLSVLYDSGAMMSYSLNATAAYEGWRISINGSGGRLEAFCPDTGFQGVEDANHIKVYDLNNNMTAYRVSKLKGVHGGADALMLRDLLRGVSHDPLERAAGTRAGADAVLIGAAANYAIKHGVVVNVDALLAGTVTAE